MIRSPICTILGHVDAGKTSLLDALRNSNIQKKEAGNITQKMGVTMMNKDIISEIAKDIPREVKIPGIILIDTPGHQCFSNLRICGLIVSDIIVVVVDLFKGLEQQTVDCINMLHEYKRPFIIAANKIDRLYGWKGSDNMCLKKTFANQKKETLELLNNNIDRISSQLSSYGFNSQVYYKNNNLKTVISIVPISAKTGEGISDLIMLINVFGSQYMTKKLEIDNKINGGYILETLKDKKYGLVIPSILTNGSLKQGDNILTFDENNEIVQLNIDHLYVPQDGHEMKDSISITQINEINDKIPIVLKIDAEKNLKPGAPFYVLNDNKDIINELFDKYKAKYFGLNKVKFSKCGVQINAKTYNSAQALGEMCNSNGVCISKIKIGNVNKKDLMKMNCICEKLIKNDDDAIYYKRYMVIFAYDTIIDKEVEKMAEMMNIKIISDPIIYKIFTQYEAYVEKLNQILLKKHVGLRAMCEFEIIDKFIFHKKNPLIFGVTVKKNKLHVGMIIETEKKNGEIIRLGKIVSIQKNEKPVDYANETDVVCVKIELVNKTCYKYEYGKDFNNENILRSHLDPNEAQLLIKYSDIFK